MQPIEMHNKKQKVQYFHDVKRIDNACYKNKVSILSYKLDLHDKTLLRWTQNANKSIVANTTTKRIEPICGQKTTKRTHTEPSLESKPEKQEQQISYTHTKRHLD